MNNEIQRSSLFLFLIVFTATKAAAFVTTASTTSGFFVGKIEDVSLENDDSKTEINVFLGIPYAEPPVGERRLNFSKLKSRMFGVYSARDFKPMCPQSTDWTETYKSRFPESALQTSESCLFLNVYSPRHSSDGSLKPVMIWIHGGTYLKGTGNIHDGKLMAAIGDVVVVTFNYRLGVLGFLAPDPQQVSTNFGLMDQVLAIQWVSKNIRKFGGDPESITLFGESAGASSISLLAFQPSVNTIIKRVILESGTAFVPWAIVSDPKSKAIEFAQEAGCQNVEPNSIINCLREKSVDEIIQGQERSLAKRGGADGIWLGPVYDNGLLNKNSQLSMQFAELDHLIGTNSQEGAFIYDTQMEYFRKLFNVDDSKVGMPLSIFQTLVNLTAFNLSPEYASTVQQAIEYRYTDFTNASDGFRRAETYIDAATDMAFFLGIMPFAQYHSNVSRNIGGGSTYFYYFDHRGSWESQEPWRTGADHADDVPFVFGFPFALPYNSSQEIALSTAMIKFWTNFAKTGDPNLPVPVEYPVTWPEYVIGEEKYIRLASDEDPDKLRGQHPFADRVAFWKTFLPKLLGSFPAPTTCNCLQSKV